MHEPSYGSPLFALPATFAPGLKFPHAVHDFLRTVVLPYFDDAVEGPAHVIRSERVPFRHIQHVRVIDLRYNLRKKNMPTTSLASIASQRFKIFGRDLDDVLRQVTSRASHRKSRNHITTQGTPLQPETRHRHVVVLSPPTVRTSSQVQQPQLKNLTWSHIAN